MHAYYEAFLRSWLTKRNKNNNIICNLYSNFLLVLQPHTRTHMLDIKSNWKWFCWCSCCRYVLEPFILSFFFSLLVLFVSCYLFRCFMFGSSTFLVLAKFDMWRFAMRYIISFSFIHSSRFHSHLFSLAVWGFISSHLILFIIIIIIIYWFFCLFKILCMAISAPNVLIASVKYKIGEWENDGGQSSFFFVCFFLSVLNSFLFVCACVFLFNLSNGRNWKINVGDICLWMDS